MNEELNYMNLSHSKTFSLITSHRKWLCDLWISLKDYDRWVYIRGRISCVESKLLPLYYKFQILRSYIQKTNTQSKDSYTSYYEFKLR